MNYSAEVLADSPAGYWRLSEASGNPQDSSGNGNHVNSITGAGSITYSQTGAILSDVANQAVRLTQVLIMKVPDHATLDLGDVFTVEAWVKRTRTGVEEAIVSKDFSAYYVRFQTNNRICLLSSSVAEIVESTVTVTDTNWHHVVATKNGATVKLYLDSTDVTGTVSNATCGNNPDPLRIGTDNLDANPASMYFDEVAVYPTALSPARVTTHYQTGISQGAAVAWITA